MENKIGKKDSITLPEVRITLIGGRWAGKSSSGNTILRRETFECGRTRTAQSEMRHGIVEGRKLILVDAPGWRSSLSLEEIPEGDKQRFKLNPFKCSPGPQVFLLVIPIDSAFSVEQRRTVEQHMKLLGERIWKYTMVLFTCGDYLGEKTIEQHIESEGDALRWLTERCKNRYHVINNKDKKNLSQVKRLLEKIDDMVWHNSGSYYEVDEQTLTILEKKQREVAERAKKRQRMVEEDNKQQKRSLIPEEIKPIPTLNMILLGSRCVGKTSVGNTILGLKEQEEGKRTACSVARQGFVGKTEITLVDTPGWWKGFPECDTPEAINDELVRSMFLCPPGPHIFLVVIDADASFNAKHLGALTSHVELLGEGVWSHSMVVFTRGDWLGTRTIEEYIEGEGEALQSLVEQCGNRYHVMDNKNTDDGTQITELLEKITVTLAGKSWSHFVPDEQKLKTLEEKQRRVEERAKLRESQIKARRKLLRETRPELQELRIVMLGPKTSGKSATANNFLRKEVFPTYQNEHCKVEEGEVAGRRITVIDTPGWWSVSTRCTKEIDKEIVRGLSLSPLGFHAVLLVIPLDLAFKEVQRVALEEHMNLLDASVWKNTMVLFTYGDKLADKSIEEHIEREHSALHWLVDKCENKYHVMNNIKKNDVSQVTELFEKIEEMVAGNSGQLFCPDIRETHLRINDKFRRKHTTHVLMQQLEQEYKRRELVLMMGFKEKLLELQADIRGSETSAKPKSLSCDMNKIKVKGIGLKKKDGKEKGENIDAKICEEIEKLDKHIMKSMKVLQSSMDWLIPDLKGDGLAPSIAESLPDREKTTSDKVLCWLSALQNFNFSQTSGYRSELHNDDLDFDTATDIVS